MIFSGYNNYTWKSFIYHFLKVKSHAFTFVVSPIARIGLNNIILQNRFPLFPNTFFFLPQKLEKNKTKQTPWGTRNRSKWGGLAAAQSNTMGFCFLSVHRFPFPFKAHTKPCMTFWFQAPVLQFFHCVLGRNWNANISSETIILFGGIGRRSGMGMTFF